MAMGEEDHVIVSVRTNPSRRFKIRRSGDDSISDLPDAVLHHIFSYIPTKFAIITSVLSKRWRHVWSEASHLSFESLSVSPESISETLANYSASRVTSFHLRTRLAGKVRHVDSWIEFAMSHNVVNLSLEFPGCLTTIYSFPDCFYSNSSLEQLMVDSGTNNIDPRCNVSWASLKDLSLSCCEFSDESFLKVLSGCPILETLTLQGYDSLRYLDLSELLHLIRLDIDFSPLFRGPITIVAPQIHYLKLRNSEAKCTLVDVSSLTEADVEFSYMEPGTLYYTFEQLKPDDLQVIVQAMLDKLQNVEKLTLGVNFLQILSLSKIPSLPLPMLRVTNLTLEVMIMRSVVPGIAILLQNSHGLNKLTVYTIEKHSTLLEKCVNSYLESQENLMNPDQCWRLNDVIFPTSSESEEVEPELMASFMELLLANTITLETLVIRLGSSIDRSRFEELSEIALTLSRNSKVSIVLKQTGA